MLAPGCRRLGHHDLSRSATSIAGTYFNTVQASPDGAWVAYVAEGEVVGEYHAYVVRTDGTGHRRLNDLVLHDSQMRWSGDSAALLISTSSGNPGDVYLARPDGSLWQYVNSEHPLTETTMSWSGGPTVCVY